MSQGPPPQPPPLGYYPAPPRQSGISTGAKIALGIVISGCVVMGGCFACAGLIWDNTKRNLNLNSNSAASSGELASGIKERKPDKPLEYQLAVINAGGFVSADDITVKRFRFLLTDLQKRTGYTQQQIADLNTYAVDTLRDRYGRNVKLLDFMEQSSKQLNLNAHKLSYKEVIAAMIVVAGRGQG